MSEYIGSDYEEDAISNKPTWDEVFDGLTAGLAAVFIKEYNEDGVVIMPDGTEIHLKGRKQAVEDVGESLYQHTNPQT